MKALKNISCLFIILSLILSAFAACSEQGGGDDESDLNEEPTVESSTGNETLSEVPFSSEESDENNEPTAPIQDSTPDASPESTPAVQETLPNEQESSSTSIQEPITPATTLIKLNGSGYSVSEKNAVSSSGNVLTIIKAGTYTITGTLNNAQLRVAVEKTEKVSLIFAGVSITNKVSAPLYIESADKVSIELAANTTNTFTDAKTYYFPEGEDKPNACIYSSEDLTIKGNGTLIVKAYYNNGIGSKNDLKIKGGDITVEAANNALKGNQSVTVEGGNLTLKGSDGIKSDSALENEGVVDIIAGAVTITAGDDGIQATTRVTVGADALVTVNAADKDINCEGIVEKQPGSFVSK